MQAPVPVAMATMPVSPPLGPEYHNGICGCGESCCAVMFCPCCVVGSTESMIETGIVKQPCDGINPSCFVCCLTSIFGFEPCYSTFVARQKIRTKFGMADNCCLDFCSHLFCPACAICQDYNETKQRITGGSQPQVVMMQMPVQQQMQ